MVFSETLDSCVEQLSSVEAMLVRARSKTISKEPLTAFHERTRIQEPIWRTLISNRKWADGDSFAPNYYETMYEILRWPHEELEHSEDESEGLTKEYRDCLQDHLPSRTFFTTSNGLVGV